TAWRTSTMSDEERTSRVSVFDTAMAILPRAWPRRPEERHPLLDIQRRANTGQRESQFHQRDGDRRPHADDDGLRVEDARHARDVADHPPDERVDHVE